MGSRVSFLVTVCRSNDKIFSSHNMFPSESKLSIFTDEDIYKYLTSIQQLTFVRAIHSRLGENFNLLESYDLLEAISKLVSEQSVCTLCMLCQSGYTRR